MGRDLSVGLIDLGLSQDPFSATWWLAYSRLRIYRDYELFSQIAGYRGDAKQVVYPRFVNQSVRVQWYTDEGIEDITENAHGEPLTFVTPADCKKIDINLVNPANIPYIKMLAELHEDTAILLYWC